MMMVMRLLMPMLMVALVVEVVVVVVVYWLRLSSYGGKYHARAVVLPLPLHECTVDGASRCGHTASYHRELYT